MLLIRIYTYNISMFGQDIIECNLMCLPVSLKQLTFLFMTGFEHWMFY